ncbi:TatD family hydrolase [Candidatus Woesearchaeota archaeon]|nr:TatD family hydrolase [Candidatus Woesearchaeota archaeon]
MILIDVHAHLHWKDFKDLDEVIERAKDAGVKAIITAGVDVESNRQSLEIAKKYDIVKAALGLYPMDALSRETSTELNTDINNYVDEELKFIETNKKDIIAISEIGLDFVSNKTDMKLQMETFVKQLKLAKKLNLPVIVHSRKAEADVINLLENEKMKKVVLHCFCGKRRLVKKAIECGWYFSIPTNVVKSQQFQEMVETIPLQQILTETDSPFLSPYPGMRNEPAFVAEAVKKIANIKKIEQEEAANIIFSNYQRLFL